MIPYELMTLEDFSFYWGESVVYHKRRGRWHAMIYTGHSGRDSGYTLEELSRDKGVLSFGSMWGKDTDRFEIDVDPLEPFDSSNWITYEPPLGYFLLENQLLLLTSGAPRSRHKGLHSRRLLPCAPLDEDLLQQGALRVAVPSRDDVPWACLVLEIARRMNEPFSPSWHHSIVGALVATKPASVILDSSTIFVPDKGTAHGHLLYKGTLLGQIHMKSTSLTFLPRTEPTTDLERGVVSRILSKLVTPPPQEIQHG